MLQEEHKEPHSFLGRFSVVNPVLAHGQDLGQEAGGVLEISSGASGESGLSPRPRAGLLWGMSGSVVLLSSASG